MATEKLEHKVCVQCSRREDPELPDDIRSMDPTPLMCAVYSGHVECIDELLKIKGNRRPPAKKCGKSIILWAIKNCQNNLDEVVKSLVIKGRVNIDTALHLAVEGQDVSSVEFLIKAGANVNKPDSDGVTAIHRTLGWGVGRKELNQQLIAKMLINGGADVNKRSLVNDTALHAAIFARYDGCIQMILRAGANVNAVNNLGETAVDVALDPRKPIKPESLALLIEAGAVMKKENMFQLINVACQSITLARALIAKGADVNIIDRSRRNLLFSASKAKAECIRLFLKEGVYVNNSDVYGNNALQHFLLKDGNNGQVAMLLFAAGEKLYDDDEFSQLEEIAPEYREVLKTQCRLDAKCRDAIRQHLLKLDPHRNLLMRIPQLPISALLRDFLLYNVSEEDDDDDVVVINDDDDDVIIIAD